MTMQVKEQLRMSVTRVAALEQEVRRHEEGSAALTSQVEGLTRLLQQHRDQLAEAEERANKDRNKRQRVEEENKVCVGGCG
jgi:predicted RNase H-like nuclease (RuvC/YqgF family)